MPDTSQPRLLSFTLDGWTALGGQVSVFLDDRVGVLVGRNGAGKSAILEGFDAISSWATGKTSRVRLFESDSIPNILDIEILTPTQRRLRYKYEVISLPNSTDDSDIDDSTSDSLEESQLSWNEHCQYIDGDKEELWTTETGVTTFGNGDTPSILGSTNSLRQLHLPKNSRLKLPEEMQWVHTVLRGVRFLGKAPVRQTFEGEGEEYVSSVLLDGINIGLLSDGTLRVLSILIEIIASYPSATTIIEEPETQIHPGMLAKLLNEIEAKNLLNFL